MNLKESNRKGNLAEPLQPAMGRLHHSGGIRFSDEETSLMLQENPYLQYFCGYPDYDDEKLPFDPSLMMHFRKRLTPEMPGVIDEMIVRDAKQRQKKEEKPGGGTTITLTMLRELAGAAVP